MGIPIGIGLLYFSNNVKEFTYDYTDCVNAENKTCAEILQKSLERNAVADDCICVLPVTLTENYDGGLHLLRFEQLLPEPPALREISRRPPAPRSVGRRQSSFPRVRTVCLRG